jgi:hypothetical protein
MSCFQQISLQKKTNLFREKRDEVTSIGNNQNIYDNEICKYED